MNGTENIGAAIRTARKKNGYTQEKLAELLEVTPTHVKHIESGRRLPSVEILFQAAKRLNFSIDDLLMRDAPPSTSAVDTLMQKGTKKERLLLERIAEAIMETQ